MLLCVIMTVAGFLSGSIMFSYLLPKYVRKVDIRQDSEDGNPGSMNAIIAVGPLLGIFCMTLDVLKAFIPVFISVSFLDVSGYYLIPVMVAPVLGHAFSPFLSFRGGKAVSVAFGSLLGAINISMALFILIIIMVFFRFIVVLNPDSIKVITVFSLAGIVVLIFEPLAPIKIAMIIIGLVVCGKHLANPNSGEISVAIGPFKITHKVRNLESKKKT